MRRDGGQVYQDDNLAMVFDTFFDHHTAFYFMTNPLGALGDCQLGEAAGATNCDYNSVWDVRTGRFEHGWTAEFKIPFKSLRYRPVKDQVWGINLRRVIRYRNETTFLIKMPIAFGAIAAKVVLTILPGPAMTTLGARSRLVRRIDERSNAMICSLF